MAAPRPSKRVCRCSGGGRRLSTGTPKKWGVGPNRQERKESWKKSFPIFLFLLLFLPPNISIVRFYFIEVSLKCRASPYLAFPPGDSSLFNPREVDLHYLVCA